MTLGEKLQKLRTDAGLSQEELAGRLEVSRQAISKWELDKTVPEVKYIVALSQLFQVSTDYLLKDDAAAPRQEAPPRQEAAPAVRHRDNSTLISVLLLCGDVFLVTLVLLRFLMLLFFSYRVSLILLVLVLMLAPIFLLLTRVFLRFPAKALSLCRHAAAACLTLWGCALALMLDSFWGLVQNLQVLHTGGHLSFLLPLGLIAGTVAALYTICYHLMRGYIKPPAQ